MGIIEKMKISKKMSVGGFNELKNTLVVTEDDKTKILQDLFEGPRKSWYKELASSFTPSLFKQDQTKEKKRFALKQQLQGILQQGSTRLAELAEPAKTTSLSPEDQACISQYINMSCPKLTSAEQVKVVNLISSVYQEEIASTKSKKEAIFKRVIGLETYKLMQPLLNTDPSKISEDACNKVLASAKKELKVNQWIDLGAAGLSAIGVALVLMAQFATGGIFTLVELGVGVAAAISWAVID